MLDRNKQANVSYWYFGEFITNWGGNTVPASWIQPYAALWHRQTLSPPPACSYFYVTELTPRHIKESIPTLKSIKKPALHWVLRDKAELALSCAVGVWLNHVFSSWFVSLLLAAAVTVEVISPSESWGKKTSLVSGFHHKTSTATWLKGTAVMQYGTLNMACEASVYLAESELCNRWWDWCCYGFVVSLLCQCSGFSLSLCSVAAFNLSDYILCTMLMVLS